MSDASASESPEGPPGQTTGAPGGQPPDQRSDATGDQDDNEAAEQDIPVPTRHRRRVWRLVALILGLSLLLAGTGTALAGWLYVRSVDHGIARFDPFSDVPAADRPAKVTEKAMNLLVLGTDSQAQDEQTARADTIILVHVSAEADRAQLISIPRDTWVRVPKNKDGTQGGRDAKINAAMAWGGMPLMVQTVESFTGVRIDHVLVFDFAGFTAIIDALDGVDIKVESDFTSIHEPHREFTAGVQHMDGATALDYARQRKQFNDGDFRRIRHQQQVIQAVLDRASDSGLLTDPFRLNAFIQATADAISVDRDFAAASMAVRLRDLREQNLDFITSPSAGTGQIDGQSVVLPDREAAKKLFTSVRDDTVD